MKDEEIMEWFRLEKTLKISLIPIPCNGQRHLLLAQVAQISQNLPPNPSGEAAPKGKTHDPRCTPNVSLLVLGSEDEDTIFPSKSC